MQNIEATHSLEDCVSKLKNSQVGFKLKYYSFTHPTPLKGYLENKTGKIIKINSQVSLSERPGTFMHVIEVAT